MSTLFLAFVFEACSSAIRCSKISFGDKIDGNSRFEKKQKTKKLRGRFSRSTRVASDHLLHIEKDTFHMVADTHVHTHTHIYIVYIHAEPNACTRLDERVYTYMHIYIHITDTIHWIQTHIHTHTHTNRTRETHDTMPLPLIITVILLLLLLL